MKWKYIAKRLLQIIINRDNSILISYESIFIIEGQKSSPIAKDSQFTISDFYESPNMLTTLEEDLHKSTNGTIRGNEYSSMGQPLRRANNLLHLYNIDSISQILIV